MDAFFLVVAVFACLLTFVTVLTYERLVDYYRSELERVTADADLFSELLNEALSPGRHPVQRGLYVVRDTEAGAQ